MSDDFTYLVPRDTAAILKSHADRCENLGLILSRYVPKEVVDNSEIPGKRHQRYRDGWLRDVCQQYVISSDNRDWVDTMIAVHKRWLAMTNDALQFALRLQGRLVVGLGGKGVLEFGITLHAITGLPIIPGSALKGLARSYALLSIAEAKGVDGTNSETLDQLDAELMSGRHDVEAVGRYYRMAFGSQDLGGGCVFHESIPIKLSKDRSIFVIDVMTPHFSEYYRSGGGRPPHDADKPNPVSYMTVSSGLTFGFAVGGRGVENPVVQQAARWLKSGLLHMGVGAKTAAGYGVFAEPKQPKR
jgi:CRISPR-associated protein Cmr6